MKDLLLIVATAVGCAAIVGVMVVIALRLLRRRTIIIQVGVVAVGAVAATVSGTIGVAQAMFLSPHDLTVQLYVSAAAGIVAAAMSLALSRWMVRTSTDLTAATRTLGEGEALSLVDAPRSAELDGLAAELATTHRRLAESRKRERAVETSRRELIAWISHDLRTPLAGLRAMAEALEDGVASDTARYHRQMRTQVDRLTAMVDDLFELSRIQSGMLQLSLDNVRLYEMVSDILADVGPIAAANRVRLDGDSDQAVSVRVDSREFTRALSNLLINAIRHTPADGTVAVSAHQTADHAVITVTDGCGGIPEPELSRVFDTGWRGNGSRSPEQLGGAGLGLAIVTGIVHAHSGRTSVRNIPGGCCFEIALPLVSAV